MLKYFKIITYISTLFFTCIVLSGCAASTTKPTINVVMTTSYGDIYLELYPKQAPITVANFLKYVDNDAYKNASFYRVVRLDNQEQNNVKIEVIQGGNGMEEKSQYPAIFHETTQYTGIKHSDGVISMGRLAPGTATSEFFICINDQPALDFGGLRNPDGQGFAAFGKVTAGMDIVRKIQSIKVPPPAAGAEAYTFGQILSDEVSYTIKRASVR